MFMLAKKDTPKKYIVMYYAVVLNLAICYFNLFIGNPVSAVFSLVVAIGVGVFIKHLTHKELWDKLTQGGSNTFSGTDSPGGV